MSPTSSHGYILDRNHRRAQKPATKSSSSSQKDKTISKTTRPDSNTGMLFKRDPWIFSREQLVYARTMLLRNVHNIKLSPKRKSQVAKAMKALDRRVDGDNVILERLGVPRSEEEAKAVMAPGDVKRVRMLRKVMVRKGGERVYNLAKGSKKKLAAKEVQLACPIVGGEGGMKFIVRSRARRMSKLSHCVNASSLEDEGKSRPVECV
ncbi:hypothetical protein GRF29_28g2028435 [Pseudopithomyces chartarum]|uniref:Uncharacterized protein n=1 Tax=Pseudopithomyces chartarum TaxID=1892770 RepID=A0AAN6M0L9_9PLEO|nr:hypothetical protein GRF29_28g2028435 [Pseudopithomyces chartarum]